jgi:hypothetical protein
MHRSQLPFRYWFIAIHLLASTKKSFSAMELQRQLVHKFYEPIWALLHKLSSAMGKRDAQYELSDIIELDEGFFSTKIEDDQKGKSLKLGRGSQKKSKVLVVAESVPVDDDNKPGDKWRKVNHIKLLQVQSTVFWRKAIRQAISRSCHL